MEQSIQRFSRKCHTSGREFQPGEVYYSALMETLQGIERLDFAEEAWASAPEDSFCWWKSRLPLPSQIQIRWAPERILIAYLDQCYEREDWGTLNVLALAYARRKLLTINYAKVPSEDPATPASRKLVLTVKSSGDNYEIPEVDLSTIDLPAIQADLDQHLFTDHVEDELEQTGEETA